MSSKIEIVLDAIRWLIENLPTWVWILIGVFIVLMIIGYLDSKREIIKNKKVIKLTKPVLPTFMNDGEMLRYVKKATVLIEVDAEEQGTGVLISKYGFIITTFCNVKFKGKVEVTSVNGEKHVAKILHMDDEHNLALLKIKGKNFIAAPKAESSNYETGEKIFAIGAPWKNDIQDNTVTSGIINTKRNSDGCKILQTDASINDDLHGGPLVNSRGELIGINIFETVEEKDITFNASFTVDINHAFKRLRIRY